MLGALFVAALAAANPTPTPTSAPTSAPSAPSSCPTVAPTLSLAPTRVPTSRPSPEPTTSLPSPAPSSCPTAAPTMTKAPTRQRRNWAATGLEIGVDYSSAAICADYLAFGRQLNWGGTPGLVLNDNLFSWDGSDLFNPYYVVYEMSGPYYEANYARNENGMSIELTGDARTSKLYDIGAEIMDHFHECSMTLNCAARTWYLPIRQSSSTWSRFWNVGMCGGGVEINSDQYQRGVCWCPTASYAAGGSFHSKMIRPCSSATGGWDDTSGWDPNFVRGNSWGACVSQLATVWDGLSINVDFGPSSAPTTSAPSPQPVERAVERAERGAVESAVAGAERGAVERASAAPSRRRRRRPARALLPPERAAVRGAVAGAQRVALLPPERAAVRAAVAGAERVALLPPERAALAPPSPAPSAVPTGMPLPYPTLAPSPYPTPACDADAHLYRLALSGAAGPWRVRLGPPRPGGGLVVEGGLDAFGGAYARGATVATGDGAEVFVCLWDGCYDLSVRGNATRGAALDFRDADGHRFACDGVGCAESFCALAGTSTTARRWRRPSTRPRGPRRRRRPRRRPRAPAPTADPSRAPTAGPSSSPTARPSAAPSAAPSASPSASPSARRRRGRPPAPTTTRARRRRRRPRRPRCRRPPRRRPDPPTAAPSSSGAPSATPTPAPSTASPSAAPTAPPTSVPDRDARAAADRRADGVPRPLGGADGALPARGRRPRRRQMEAPGAVGSCDALTVSAASSTGGGGRPLAYAWAVVATPAGQGCAAAVAAALGDAESASVPPATMAACAPFARVTATATRFDGAAGAATAAARVDTAPLPGLAILGGAVQTARPGRRPRRGRRDRRACANSQTPTSNALTFSWSGSLRRNEAAATVTTAASALVAAIAGGDRTVDGGDAVVLDARPRAGTPAVCAFNQTSPPRIRVPLGLRRELQKSARTSRAPSRRRGRRRVASSRPARRGEDLRRDRVVGRRARGDRDRDDRARAAARRARAAVVGQPAARVNPSAKLVLAGDAPAGDRAWTLDAGVLAGGASLDAARSRASTRRGPGHRRPRGRRPGADAVRGDVLKALVGAAALSEATAAAAGALAAAVAAAATPTSTTTPRARAAVVGDARPPSTAGLDAATRTHLVDAVGALLETSAADAAATALDAVGAATLLGAVPGERAVSACARAARVASARARGPRDAVRRGGGARRRDARRVRRRPPRRGQLDGRAPVARVHVGGGGGARGGGGVVRVTFAHPARSPENEAFLRNESVDCAARDDVVNGTSCGVDVDCSLFEGFVNPCAAGAACLAYEDAAWGSSGACRAVNATANTTTCACAVDERRSVEVVPSSEIVAREFAAAFRNDPLALGKTRLVLYTLAALAGVLVLATLWGYREDRNDHEKTNEPAETLEPLTPLRTRDRAVQNLNESLPSWARVKNARTFFARLRDEHAFLGYVLAYDEVRPRPLRALHLFTDYLWLYAVEAALFIVAFPDMGCDRYVYEAPCLEPTNAYFPAVKACQWRGADVEPSCAPNATEGASIFTYVFLLLVVSSIMVPLSSVVAHLVDVLVSPGASSAKVEVGGGGDETLKTVDEEAPMGDRVDFVVRETTVALRARRAELQKAVETGAASPKTLARFEVARGFKPKYTVTWRRLFYRGETDDERFARKTRRSVRRDLQRADRYLAEFEGLNDDEQSKLLGEYARLEQLSPLEQRIYLKNRAEDVLDEHAAEDLPPATRAGRALALVLFIAAVAFPLYYVLVAFQHIAASSKATSREWLKGVSLAVVCDIFLYSPAHVAFFNVYLPSLLRTRLRSLADLRGPSDFEFATPLREGAAAHVAAQKKHLPLAALVLAAQPKPASEATAAAAPRRNAGVAVAVWAAVLLLPELLQDLVVDELIVAGVSALMVLVVEVGRLASRDALQLLDRVGLAVWLASLVGGFVAVVAVAAACYRCYARDEAFSVFPDFLFPKSPQQRPSLWAAPEETFTPLHKIGAFFEDDVVGDDRGGDGDATPLLDLLSFGGPLSPEQQQCDALRKTAETELTRLEAHAERQRRTSHDRLERRLHKTERALSPAEARAEAQHQRTLERVAGRGGESATSTLP
ncbi:hypothetical protein SO694_00044125 [Aureococcus anophagefferens]|uniref:Polycystin domain-containing protein n=1 Tax=Aureococcus anophagefferens TaxID=44056 RepID=A0ABR1G7J1_AURAN